jgi:hypothetical protein
MHAVICQVEQGELLKRQLISDPTSSSSDWDNYKSQLPRFNGSEDDAASGIPEFQHDLGLSFLFTTIATTRLFIGCAPRHFNPDSYQRRSD